MSRPILPFACLAVAAALAGCTPPPPPMNSAEACAYVQQAAVPIAMTRNVPLVTVTIDGHPATMVLDTGAEWSLISERAGKAFELQTDWSRLGTADGIGGQVVHYAVTADRFDVGELHLTNQSIGVGIVNWGDNTVHPDGYLGENILSQHDVDIDLAHGRLTLYRARNCPAGGPPWTFGYRTVAIRSPSPEHNLIAMPVQLDGKGLTATIDTGAEATVVSSRAAASLLGIDEKALEQDRGGKMFGAGPALATSHLHAFEDTRIAGEDLRHPHLYIVDLPSFAGDMLLGADFLRSHRIFISYATGRMFVAGTPARIASQATGAKAADGSRAAADR